MQIKEELTNHLKPNHMITTEEFIKLINEKKPEFKQDPSYPLVLSILETNDFLIGLKESVELWTRLEQEANSKANAELESLYRDIDARKKAEALKNTPLKENDREINVNQDDTKSSTGIFKS